MRLLLLQLSDIHVSQGDNPVLERAQKIVEATRGLDRKVDACIVLLTGDAVDTGQDGEYSVALDFVESVRRALEAEFIPAIPVHVVPIPGNHDCDFSGDQQARDLIVDSVPSSAGVPQASVIEIATQVQRGFFDFRDTVATDKTITVDGRLYYEYTFALGGNTLRIICVNSAWLSKLREVPGKLRFPADVISPRDGNAALAIAMLHHPLHWFDPESKRQLQEKLEGVSDIIFTGHEHVHTRRTQLVSSGEVNEFIEGGALQETTVRSESSFNAIVVDTALNQQNFTRFQWLEDHYHPIGTPRWEPFQVNRRRARKDFQVTPEFDAALDDPGASFTKSGRRLHLRDIFTFPELRSLGFTTGEQSEFLSASQVLADTERFQNLLITGAEQGGKTALAKMAFRIMLQNGYVPLLLDGATFTVPPKGGLEEALLPEFLKQYDAEGLEKFKQLARNRRVLIVDSFDRLRTRRGKLEALLSGLEAYAGRVILLSNDLAHAAGEIVDAQALIEGRKSFGQFRIAPFGFAKRVELTTKWYLLDETLSREDFARKLSEAEDMMRVVLGKNYVPAFPVFILAMLQGLEIGGSGVDVSASTYGYFYEILIKTQLADSSNKKQFDIRMRYLAHLAFYVFSSGKTSVAKGELEKVHREYENLYDLKLAFRDMIDDLRKRHVLVVFSDAYEFQYEYIYYYFVAAYIRDHITESTIRDTVIRMSGDLANDRSANVMLFLVHLSREPLIIQQMLLQASKQYATVTAARLEDDVKFLSENAPLLPEFTYEDGDETKRRHDLAVERDREEREGEGGVEIDFERSDGEDFYREVRRELDRLSAALKTVQILGQILKNFPGSIEAAQKDQIANECYGLAFRVLAALLDFLRQERSALVQEVMTMLRETLPNGEQAEMMRRANSVVFGLALSASYGIVKRLSFSVGSPELGLTYAKVAEQMPTVGVRLANMSIELDQFAEFPQEEIVRMGKDLADASLPLATLKWMVVSHMNLFPVHFRDKQRVCEELEINYARVVRAPTRRLLGPGIKPPSSD